MSEDEREFLKERLAIAVEHLPETDAQAVFDSIVAAFQSCGHRSQKSEARSQKAETR